MKTFRFFVASVIVVGMMSCSHPKQYSCCADLAHSLNHQLYNDLVKEWGEPSKQEEFQQVYYIKWPGVGINGKDKELMFEMDTIAGGVKYPTQFKGVNCGNN